MQILITGGTAVLGARLVPLLRSRGHQVRVLTRQDDVLGGVPGDLETGEGLEAACSGVDLVVHAASTRDAKKWRELDVAGTARLAAAARRTGVKHFVYISIIGVDAIPYAYYRAKFDAEGQVRASGVPYTVIRVAQFHEFVDSLLAALPRVGFGRKAALALPVGVKLQPIAVRDAAEVLANRIELGPSRRVETLAGPEVLDGRTLARQWLSAQGRTGRVLNLPLRGAFAASLHDGAATSPASAWPGQRFADCLRERAEAQLPVEYPMGLPWMGRNRPKDSPSDHSEEKP